MRIVDVFRFAFSFSLSRFLVKRLAWVCLIATVHIDGRMRVSWSHCYHQRCSVPVMVARRRLKRPPKRSAHLAKHRVHVSLAEAGIDRVAAKVDHSMAVWRDEMQREDERERRGEGSSRAIEDVVEAEESEAEGDGEAEGEGEGEGDSESDGKGKGKGKGQGEGDGDGAEGEGFFLGNKIRGERF